MDTDFCVAALEEALSRGRPEIFNTDQRAQFTSEAFTQTLREQGIRVSMDGEGRYLDNIFVERLWPSIKYEEVYLKAYQGVAEARSGIDATWSSTNARGRTRLWATGPQQRCTKMARKNRKQQLKK